MNGIAEMGLGWLFLSAFTSATLLPGSSEVLLDRRNRDLPILYRRYTGVQQAQVVFPEDIRREALLRRSADESPTKLDDLQGLLPRR